MAIREGIKISGHYAVSINAICLFICVLCIVKNERSDRIVFHIVFETQRPPDTLFNFGLRRTHHSGCKFELN